AAELFAVRDHVLKSVPAPTAHPDAWWLASRKSTWDEYIGLYGPSPNYQAGKIPYVNFGDGGGFEFKDGEPIVANYFDLRFSLTVPKASRCPMPEAGYPIVMFAHGTGGDYRSYVRDRTGREQAKRCIASMGVDQIFHGTRPGAPTGGSEPSLLFFNV